MNYSRPEAKLRAQASLRGAYPHPALVTLVFVLVTTVLTNIILQLVRNPFAEFYTYLMMGYDPMEVLTHLSANSSSGALYGLLQILLTLYTAVMQFGYVSYALRLARNEQPGYRNLLDGFSTVGRVILAVILQNIFTTLWGMLGMLPGAICLTVGIVLPTGGAVLVGLGILLMIGGVLFEVSVSYRYRLSSYFLLDNPSMGSLSAITQSKLAMKGRKWTLFVQDLSFLGWNILSVLTIGILGLWVAPYQYASEANFYDFAVHGGYSSPDFRQNPYGMPNGRRNAGGQGPDF